MKLLYTTQKLLGPFCLGLLTLFLNINIGVCQSTSFSENSKTDSTKITINKNSFSLILEAGKPNIFNFLGTKYEDGFTPFSTTQMYPITSYRDAFKINIDGQLSLSAGIAYNRRLATISNFLFKKDSKYFLTLKNEILYSLMTYNPNVRLNNIKAPLPMYNSFIPDNPNDIQLKIKRVLYSPSLELVKKLRRNNNYLFYSLGPEIIIMENDFKNLNIQNFKNLTEIYGGQLCLGYQINRLKLKLKYELFIPPVYFSGSGKSMFNYPSNESTFFGIYQYKRMESMNISVEVLLR